MLLSKYTQPSMAPKFFSLYRSLIRVSSIATLPSRVGVTQKWSQRLGVSNRTTKFAVGQSIQQVSRSKPFGIPETSGWYKLPVEIVEVISVRELQRKLENASPSVFGELSV